ncbi:MAG: UxaA family hydrolase [Desulfobacteraceae bacterium]|jgi:altronate hydrolase|nr:UxaA family hydrolase [Desulfobacteraceae bacterium]
MSEDPLTATFDGYLRADGRRGVRNWLVVAYTVYCAEHVARRITEPFRFKGVQLIGFDQCYPSDYGHELMEKLLTHPNVGAVLLVSLGCEEFRRSDLLATVQASGREVHSIVIQESGGTEKSIEAGQAIISKLLPRLETTTRAPMTAADLVIGLECGGSDALSGITANPAVGLFTDRLIDAGGTAIIEETNELFGCETHFASRARTPEIGEAVVRTIQKAMAYHRRLGHASFGGGNISGGLSTIEEKSAGAYAKCGTRPLDGILIPGQRPSETGLYLLDTVYDSDLRHGIPNIHDPHGVTAMAACGCHLIVFTTGRGSVVGQAVSPVIKVASNSAIYQRLAGDMDVNAGIAIESPDGLQAAAEEITRIVTRAAAGDPTRSEALGHMESYISDGYFNPVAGGCRNPAEADDTRA